MSGKGRELAMNNRGQDTTSTDIDSKIHLIIADAVLYSPVKTDWNSAVVEAKEQILALLAQQTVAARIDENQIAWNWDRSKGLQYFEERLQKRQAKLQSLQTPQSKNDGTDTNS